MTYVGNKLEKQIIKDIDNILHKYGHKKAKEVLCLYVKSIYDKGRFKGYDEGVAYCGDLNIEIYTLNKILNK